MQRTKRIENQMMDLFDILFERTLASSKIIKTLTDRVLEIATEIKSMKDSISTITKVVKLHQIMLDELANEKFSEKFEPLVIDAKNAKKEKPN